MKTFILTPVAERDVDFYIHTANALKAKGEKVLFFSLYQPGNGRLRAAGFSVYDPYPYFPKSSEPLPSPETLAQKYSMPPLQDLRLHEKLTFGIKSDQQVLEHFSRFLLACDQCMNQLERENPSSQYILIQELAGFLGPLSTFYVAMKRGWKHYFTEPGFFKGHIHFLKNSLYLNIPDVPVPADIESLVNKYLENSFQNKVIVAASKDAHHYKDMGLAKVFNSMNFKNLCMKLIYKYIFRHQFIFSHVSNHVFRYLGMLKNRYLNASAYAQLNELSSEQKWIYFPFHVQLDFSLTIRSPLWLDQLALIEKALQVLPKDTLLLAKEHPASIGCLDQKRLDAVLKNPQFRLLHPKINSYDVLEKCSGVLTINSKVGAEAISMGLPAISFGRAFYTESTHTQKFTNWDDVKKSINQWVTNPTGINKEKQQQWRHFLGQVWLDSYAIELYDNREKNIEFFARTIQALN